ncbi:MAG: phage Gp37/Gp68 family protein [bacterium]
MAQSSIEWTEVTWNPVTGCTKASPGCRNCYAVTMSRRLRAMGVEKYRNGFHLTAHPEELDRPFEWIKPRVIFVNSMSDLFHERLPLDFIELVFKTMNEADWHTYQVLTKRPELVARYDPFLKWNDNIWMGTSVEDDNVKWRIRMLQKCSAATKFLSCEPLIGPLRRMPLAGIDWVIVGGESGPRARPMKEEWVLDIRDQCRKAGVPFFFKQWGGVNKKATGRILDGRTYDEMPEVARKVMTSRRQNLPAAG